MGKIPVKLFYDVVSPYTIFAYKVLLRYETRWNLAVQLRPIFLGGVMRGSNNKPPGANAVKGAHLSTDVKRCAEYFQVPLKFPEALGELMFGNGTLGAQRYLTAVDLERPDKVRDVTDALIERIWFKDEDVMSPDGIAQASVAAGISEEQTKDLIAKMKSDEVKDRLKGVTQEALDCGAFGSPTFVFETKDGPQMVFGSDRFPIIAQLLGQKWEGPNPDVTSKL